MSGVKICTVDECHNVILAKGLCGKHYQRMYTNGTLESSFTHVKAFDRFSKLTAIRQAPSPRNKWLCKCDCGCETIVFANNLVRGHSTSCGCSAREAVTTHGKSASREYRSWINMKTRCELPGTPYYKFYGERGISVCERWRSSFENFLADMGPRPDGHSVDRIDVNGNYEPQNCRWATNKTQHRNTRRQHIVTLGGQEMTLAEAVEKTGLLYNTVLYRLKRGWSIDRALT
jgi:hypothetical protein